MKHIRDFIESAYCWEGSATTRQVTNPPPLLKFAVSGSSTVEHSGDIDGIYQQVHALKGFQSLEDDGTRYKIESATMTHRNGHREADEDYEVYVSGEVTVRKL